MNRGRIISGILLSSASCLAGTAGKAVETSAPEETRSDEWGFTGSWGGWRHLAEEQGVTLSGLYIGEVIGNMSGGLKRSAVYDGLLGLGLDLDFHRLGLWRDGSLHISTIYPHGNSPSGELVGDLLAVSNVDAWESLRLYQFWFEQWFFDERFSVRIGQLTADEEFAITEPGAIFLNAAFGWPAFISANTLNTGPAYFAATPGVRLKVEPSDRFFFQAGVFDGDSMDSPEGNASRTESGTNLHLGSDQGVFTIVETGYGTDLGKLQLAGEYKVGAWFHSGQFESVAEDGNGEPYVITGADPRVHDGNGGVYFTAEQMVWRETSTEDGQGLWTFGRIGYAPPDRNLFRLVIDGGFTYHGLLPGRDQDAVGIGLVYGEISPDIRRRESARHRLPDSDATSLPDHELVLEATYSVQVNRWLAVQPDFQWVHHPGGSGAIPDAFVIGLRSTIIF